MYCMVCGVDSNNVLPCTVWCTVLTVITYRHVHEPESWCRRVTLASQHDTTQAQAPTSEPDNQATNQPVEHDTTNQMLNLCPGGA